MENFDNVREEFTVKESILSGVSDQKRLCVELVYFHVILSKSSSLSSDDFIDSSHSLW